jgi:hypothetical protein
MADTTSDDPFFSTWRYIKPRRCARREERAAWEAQLAGSQGAASEALRLRDGVPVVEVLERTDAENY